MPIERICKLCGKKLLAYTTLQNKCIDCIKQTYKPIRKRGKQTLLYEAFRDKVARPYLDNKYGHFCSVKGCNETQGLEIHHKKTRGADHSKKMEVTNLVYLCHKHHRLVTDGKLK